MMRTYCIKMEKLETFLQQQACQLLSSKEDIKFIESSLAVWVDWTMVFHKKPFPGQVYILGMTGR